MDALETKSYRITHASTYHYSDVVPVCHNVVWLTPRDDSRQSCRSHRVTVTPTPSSMSRRRDYFGNALHFFSVDEGHRRLVVSATSKVEIRAPVKIEPDSTPAWEGIRDQLQADRSPACLDALQFVFDSAKAYRSAPAEAYAAESFTARRPILAAACDLMQRIHRDFHYQTSATTINTPVEQVFDQRAGVCQDFAHLAISCLRSIGLAARYVSGYLRTIPPPGEQRLVGADASHAWLAVFVGPGGWVDLDPTNRVMPSLDHVTLAWGRDYADVCPIKGVYVGGEAHAMSVAVDVVPLESPAPGAAG